MGKVNVEKLLTEIPPPAGAPADAPPMPCGPDIANAPEFGELERIIPGKPEQQVGTTIVPAEEPNWRDVSDMAIALLGRSKNLRVVIYLCIAQLKIEGIPGLRDGIALLRGVLEKYWDAFYPRLDPTDNNDPLERMNIVVQLAVPTGTIGDPIRFCERLQTAPLTNSRQFGKLSTRDLMMSKGELPTPEGVKPPEAALIEGAFKDTPTEEVEATNKAATEILEHVQAMDKYLDATVGVGQAPDLKPFISGVKDVLKYLQPYVPSLAGRPLGADAAGDAGNTGGGGGAGGQARLSGDISSASDVLVALDKIFRYYERYEVSSPVPVVLKAAKRLVSKNFMEIAKLMTPDAIRTIDEIAKQEINV